MSKAQAKAVELMTHYMNRVIPGVDPDEVEELVNLIITAAVDRMEEVMADRQEVRDRLKH